MSVRCCFGAKYPAAEEHAVRGKQGGWADLGYSVGVAKAGAMRDGRLNGVYRVNWDGESCRESEVGSREDCVGRLVVEHTEEVFERVVREVIDGDVGVGVGVGNGNLLLSILLVSFLFSVC